MEDDQNAERSGIFKSIYFETEERRISALNIGTAMHTKVID
jgi:hypothetical protein